MENEHLHLLIHEEIYRLPEDESEPVAEVESAAPETEIAETQEVETEPAVEVVQEEVQVAEETVPKEEVTAVSEESADYPQESPHIPHHDLPETHVLPFAVFHTSHDPAENELLHKIIDACKVAKEDYKVFSNGFDPAVQFEKALVFVPEAKAFYTPIPYKKSTFLCSKPLDVLAADQNEKMKLWEALQKFVL